MMRTGTFYLSHEPGPDSQWVGLPKGGCVYIRVTESSLTVDAALDKAKPKKGESVMNTHTLPAKATK